MTFPPSKWLSKRPVVALIQLLQICEFLSSLLDTMSFFVSLIIGKCEVVMEKDLWLDDIRKWEIEYVLVFCKCATLLWSDGGCF